ncbi:MAG: ABC transporter substrate-binding protein [Actinomycetota bacterium]|nr:ABC transporter substrate-binding protein [Actinomycetota bacterium]
MKRFTSIAALTAALLTTAACGDDTANGGAGATTTAGGAGTSAPTTDPGTDGTEPMGDMPMAIISLAPTHTETLFAIGAGDQVIAVDEFSNYPAEALAKPHELSGYEPNVEAIAALNPDLVVLSDAAIQPQLESLGIAVWVGPAAATFDDVYAEIEQLGAATGHVAEAAELVAQMQADIAAAVAGAPVPAEPLSLYHELDPTYYSVTSATFIGQVYELFGLTNIADGAEAGNDYPQLSAEYIIDAAPDLVFLADTKCCGESAETVSGRPGWNAIPAVANGHVVAMDDDISSRWGPRIVEYIAAVADALAKVPAGA